MGLITRAVDNGLELLIPALILAHLVIAPYTKVEESFNMQATHDILVYGMPTKDISRKLHYSYDHFTFPGAVPRTFIGAVLLAGIGQPLIDMVGFNHAQLIVRAVLGLFNAFAIVHFSRSVKAAYGRDTARWYLLLQASQFHVIYYASRTLPNMFAFGLTTLAFSYLLPTTNPKHILPRQRVAITMFVFAAAIFRSEVALLLVTTTLHLLIIPAISLDNIVRPFLAAFSVALALSIPVDSYFWQRPLWPELSGFYYNAIQGSSSLWGTSPWHFYFTSALPRILLVSLPLLVLSLAHPVLRPRALRLSLPSLLFTAIYSLQPHKEARFIFYVAPPLTASAALAASTLFHRRKSKGLLASLLSLALVAGLLLSFATSTSMLLLSSLNYPGGEALSHLRSTIQADPDATSSPIVSIHADVLSCMTGVTLFGSATGSSRPDPRSGIVDTDKVGQKRQPQQRVVMSVDKTEDELVLKRPEFWTRFDYLLMEDRNKVKGGKWDVIGVVEGFAGIEVVKPGQSTQGSDEVLVGQSKLMRTIREKAREFTGGWWVGPRMVPRIYILKKVRGGNGSREAVGA